MQQFWKTKIRLVHKIHPLGCIKVVGFATSFLRLSTCHMVVITQQVLSAHPGPGSTSNHEVLPSIKIIETYWYLLLGWSPTIWGQPITSHQSQAPSQDARPPRRTWARRARTPLMMESYGLELLSTKKTVHDPYSQDLTGPITRAAATQPVAIILQPGFFETPPNSTIFSGVSMSTFPSESHLPRVCFVPQEVVLIQKPPQAGCWRLRPLDQQTMFPADHVDHSNTRQMVLAKNLSV